MANILVVDDELGIRDLLFEILNDEGHTVELAENAAQARAARQLARPDVVLLDIWMPDTDGVSLLKEWATLGLLNMPVIMMSGHATIDTAVEATRIGAMAFLEKPITLQKLLKAVEQALQKKPMASANLVARAGLGSGARGQVDFQASLSRLAGFGAGGQGGSGGASGAGRHGDPGRAAGHAGAHGAGRASPPGAGAGTADRCRAVEHAGAAPARLIRPSRSGAGGPGSCRRWR